METNVSIQTTEQLAAKFSEVLRRWLKPKQLEKINRLNRHETNKSICHSHDFCDANQAMLDAMEALGMSDFNPSDESLMELINAAWDMAKAAGFDC